MAAGPHSADAAQRYLLQVINSNVPEETYQSIRNSEEAYDGEESWTIGSVFNESNLIEFDNSVDGYDKPEEVFESLDKVFQAIRTTRSNTNNYRKIEGLEAVKGNREWPTTNEKTQFNWMNDYEEAGLVKNERVTTRGQKFINRTNGLNDTVFAQEDYTAGDFYRKLVTRGYGNSEPHTGDKIQAFFLYGSGMSHTEISDALGVASSTVRSMASDLEEMDL